MPLFRYKAAKPSGEVLVGEMDATSAEAVIRQLQADGNIPIRAEPLERVAASGIGRRRVGAPRRNDIAVFTLELATLLEAGLPLDRALTTISKVTDSEALRALVDRINAAVRGGDYLSDALAAQGGVFTPLYVNLVRAGETGGALNVTLSRLAEYLEQTRQVRETVISALIYPLILVTLAIASVVLMLTFVVPRFAELFEDAGERLPMATQIVVSAGAFFEHYWWAVLGVSVLVVVVARQQLAIPEVRLRFDRWALHAPIAGDLIAKVEAARFARTMATLLDNGVPLPTALGISAEIVSNRAVAAGITQMAESVRAGNSMAASLMERDVFPRLTAHMLEVGEETGELENMLTRLATIYDREVKSTLQRAIAVAEPILIVGIGLLVGGIIFSIMIAVLSVNEIAL